LVYTQDISSDAEKEQLRHLHHYSVDVALDSVREWVDTTKQIKNFVAVDNVSGKENGFVHFQEKVIKGRPVVYIAQAGTSLIGSGIGRRLMQCVLINYPAGTEFLILTRVFNKEAINLYQNRLGFKPIDIDMIKELGYDERYCGFRHKSTREEIEAIRDNTLLVEKTRDVSKAILS
jgi:ribosomal protein S18 acetylase RimI-like enzyme